MATTLLIIEDNRSLALALAAAAERAGLQTRNAPSLARAREILGQRSFDGILLDIGLPDGHGLELVEQWQWEQRPEIAVISAHGEIENAIAARKLGIARFFDKPADFEELQAFFQSLRQPRPRPGPTSPDTRAPFVGASASMRPVFRQIAHACVSDQAVVIRGASGSGRSQVARLIHQSSDQDGRPKVVQCSPELQCEPLQQAFDESGGKTLILESIQTLPVELQQVVLQGLDQASGQAPRLLVTTDEGGLLEATERGDFLHALYLRLQLLKVDLPPLKQRVDDIPAISNCFLGELGAAGVSAIDDSVLEVFQVYDWPGNLRELRDVIHHAISASRGSKRITLADIPPHLIAPVPRRRRVDDDLTFVLDRWLDEQLERGEGYKQILAKLEGTLLDRLLSRYDNKPSRLAAALAINRSTLRKKLKSKPPEER